MFVPLAEMGRENKNSDCQESLEQMILLLEFRVQRENTGELRWWMAKAFDAGVQVDWRGGKFSGRLRVGPSFAEVTTSQNCFWLFDIVLLIVICLVYTSYTECIIVVGPV